MTLISFLTEKLDESIPTPLELEEEIPLKETHARFIRESREAVEAILNGWDPRLLLIVGPCSIHDMESAKEYAYHFKKLSNEVSDQFFLVMRTYFEKPRTSLGWKGLLYDPDLNGSFNLSKGIRLARQLLATLADMEIPTGCELLEIATPPYYADFLTWGCIGARTSTSPPHRQLAASLPLPIGFKNTMDGSVEHPIHALVAANAEHVFLGVSSSGQMTKVYAEGNPLCHLVLRGGSGGPNYSNDAIEQTAMKCRLAGVRDRLIIDCSHDNCEKNPLKQVHVFNSVIDQRLSDSRHIAGLMLESHIHGGFQTISFPLRYGVSVTDPCLDWKTTEMMIRQAAQKLRHV